jgi:hypothetical protein
LGSDLFFELIHRGKFGSASNSCDISAGGLMKFMNSERSQRGFISISGIFSLLMLVVIAFVAIKLVPPYFSNYQLQDGIQNIALIASYNPITEEEILHNVISRASSVGIDLTPKQVTVHKGAGTVIIVVSYMVTVDLFVKRIDIQFEPSTTNKNITAK